MFSMKSLLLTSAFVAASSISFATPTTVVLNCAGYSVSGGAGAITGGSAFTSGVQSLSCPGIALPGGTNVFSSQIIISTDYSGGLGGNTTGANSVKGTWSDPGTNGFSLSGLPDTLTASNVSPFSNSGAYTQTGSLTQSAANYIANTTEVLAQAAAGFSVGVNAFANGANGTTGTVQTLSNTLQVIYTYDTTSGTPEPASFAMIGGGLLALGFAARRRRA